VSDLDFDKLLDEMLKEEARIEPRIGIERRVLERVRMEEAARLGWRRRWWFAPATVAGCLLVVIATNHRFQNRGGSVASATRPAPSPVEITKVNVPINSQKTTESKSAQTSLRTKRWELPVDGIRVARERELVKDQRLPKMDTFPAVTEKASLAGWRSDVTSPVPSPEAAQALLELKAQQASPLQVDAIEIQPL